MTRQRSQCAPVGVMPNPHIQISWRLDINSPTESYWVIHFKNGFGRSGSETYLTEDSLARQ